MPRNKNKAKPKPPAVTYKFKDMWACKNAQAMSGLNQGIRDVINSIMTQGNAHQAFFNHLDDRDPALNGLGSVPNGVRVEIYYQPATQDEVAMGDTIGGSTILSGRRRLAVRYQDDKDPFQQVWVVSFYLTNHPKRKEGQYNPNKNEYGQYVPIDPAK
jgi:hypothetical protein